MERNSEHNLLTWFLNLNLESDVNNYIHYIVHLPVVEAVFASQRIRFDLGRIIVDLDLDLNKFPPKFTHPPHKFVFL